MSVQSLPISVSSSSKRFPESPVNVPSSPMSLSSSPRFSPVMFYSGICGNYLFSTKVVRTRDIIDSVVNDIVSWLFQTHFHSFSASEESLRVIEQLADRMPSTSFFINDKVLKVFKTMQSIRDRGAHGYVYTPSLNSEVEEALNSLMPDVTISSFCVDGDNVNRVSPPSSFLMRRLSR